MILRKTYSVVKKISQTNIVEFFQETSHIVQPRVFAKEIIVCVKR